MIRCLIVDDEQRSCDILKKMLTQYCREVMVLDYAFDAEDAKQKVNRYQPDLVFLDIEMPGGDGFYFLEGFSEISFSVIFTTAYDQYAIRAFRYSALDYLLKPINIEELQNAVERHQSQREMINMRYGVMKEHIKTPKPGFSRLAVPTLQGFDLVEVQDILWVQASDSYAVFHLKNRSQLVSSYSLKRYEEILCEDHPFFRIHHASLVNLNEVTRFVRTKNPFVVMSNGKELEVSIRKKDALLQVINRGRM